MTHHILPAWPILATTSAKHILPEWLILASTSAKQFLPALFTCVLRCPMLAGSVASALAPVAFQISAIFLLRFARSCPWGQHLSLAATFSARSWPDSLWFGSLFLLFDTRYTLDTALFLLPHAANLCTWGFVSSMQATFSCCIFSRCSTASCIPLLLSVYFIFLWFLGSRLTLVWFSGPKYWFSN